MIYELSHLYETENVIRKLFNLEDETKRCYRLMECYEIDCYCKYDKKVQFPNVEEDNEIIRTLLKEGINQAIQMKNSIYYSDDIELSQEQIYPFSISLETEIYKLTPKKRYKLSWDVREYGVLITKLVREMKNI